VVVMATGVDLLGVRLGDGDGDDGRGFGDEIGLRAMPRFVPSPDSFVVEEIPAYQPCGEGAHTYLWIEKRDLTTAEAERRLARVLGVEPRDVGHAGLKDRHATTRQFLSVPGVAPEAALAAAAGLAADGLRVLSARQHGNKLRMGHLDGNRFEVVVDQVGDGEAEALGQRLAALAREGLPNWYGEQRFGAGGENVARALALLRGQLRERDRRRRQFLLSALQSAVFNRTLALRAERGGLLAVRAGDVLCKVASGGLFVSEDPAVDGPRVAAGELVPTGPMPGNREREPPPGSEARRLEDDALAALGVAREELAPLGRDLPGARRPVVVPVTLGEPPVEPLPEGRARLRFSLPAGSYATVLVEALDVLVSPFRPAATGAATVNQEEASPHPLPPVGEGEP
jgi:tRNA pseudouridine13 synthase